MASLKNLLQKTVIDGGAESNLEKGRIYAYEPGSDQGVNFWNGGSGNFCWASPGTGTVTVEIWGASGSASRMCCCGAGLPGNPGAYSKKTFNVNSASCIIGCTGLSCGNPSTLCFRGCSAPTMLCWVGASGTNGCMCAQGGMSGLSVCISSSSIYCCFIACGMCFTLQGSDGCGWICNYGSVYNFIPCGYGGDVNCCGGISKVFFGHCNSCCWCCNEYRVRTSPGIFAEQGGEVAFNFDMHEQGGSVVSGPYMLALSSMSRQPPQGMPYTSCWSSGGTSCGCYEYFGCHAYLGVGIPGPGVTPCSGVRDVGMRGGHGAVRIKYQGTGLS